MLNKPYAESCDQNREPILSVIKPLLTTCNNVLEIGSGTGQHAVYFAKSFPHLNWHPSDCDEYLPGIRQWVLEAESTNIIEPVQLNVSSSTWPDIDIDCVFSANTVHIMNWTDVKALFSGVGSLLKAKGKLILYGPFNYQGQYTSDSNMRFDNWLKARNSGSAIRNFEDVCKLAELANMKLLHDYEMPANNRILVWEKI